MRDDASTNIVGFACTLTYLCNHPPTTSSLQAHSPLNPRSSSFQVIALHARSVLPPMHHRSPSPGTLLLSPRIPSLFPRRANHTMKNVTKGKGIVTAAVHESTSACRGSTHQRPRLTLGSSEPTRSRCSTSFHHDRKNHLLSREVSTTQRDEG